MLTLDPVKKAACKTDHDVLILTLETMQEELKKDVLAQNTQGLAETKKQVEDQLKDFSDRLAKAYPRFSMPGVELGDGEKKNAFSWSRAAVAIAKGDWRLAPYEGEIYNSKEHRDFIEKAHSFGIDSAGGFLVPSELSSKFIEKLQPASIAFGLGVNQVEVGNVASLTFNREASNSTAEWVGEMLSATKTDVGYSQMTVSPKALSARTDISNLLQLLGSNAAETRFLDNATKMFGQAIDRGILIGPATLSPKAPTGIANTGGVGTSVSASLTYDMLVDFEDKLLQANAYMGRLGWAMSASQYTIIRKLKDTSGQPIVYRSLTAPGQKELFGFPIGISTQMGTTGANTLAFGDWSQATLFSWFGGLIMQRSTVSDNALDNDLTRIALRRYCDVGVDQPAAFCFAST